MVCRKRMIKGSHIYIYVGGDIWRFMVCRKRMIATKSIQRSCCLTVQRQDKKDLSDKVFTLNKKHVFCFFPTLSWGWLFSLHAPHHHLCRNMTDVWYELIVMVQRTWAFFDRLWIYSLSGRFNQIDLAPDPIGSIGLSYCLISTNLCGCFGRLI